MIPANEIMASSLAFNLQFFSPLIFLKMTEGKMMLIHLDMTTINSSKTKNVQLHEKAGVLKNQKVIPKYIYMKASAINAKVERSTPEETYPVGLKL